MQESDSVFMQLALDQAKVALANQWIPVGAVFVHRGHVVAHGVKSGHTHTLWDHAEHNGCYEALWSREGPKNLKDFTVYSTLEPCLICISMLITTRVSRIVFACEDPYSSGRGLLENPGVLPGRFKTERPICEGGILREESRALLRDYFNAQKDTGRENWSNPENPLVKMALAES
jgi:tRNA(adenine34) deaminase